METKKNKNKTWGGHGKDDDKRIQEAPRSCPGHFPFYSSGVSKGDIKRKIVKLRLSIQEKGSMKRDVI
jgi:hypothetical protein